MFLGEGVKVAAQVLVERGVVGPIGRFFVRRDGVSSIDQGDVCRAINFFWLGGDKQIDIVGVVPQPLRHEVPCAIGIAAVSGEFVCNGVLSGLSGHFTNALGGDIACVANTFPKHFREQKNNYINYLS